LGEAGGKRKKHAGNRYRMGMSTEIRGKGRRERNQWMATDAGASPMGSGSGERWL